jgi:hypothetical protein
VPDRGEGRFDWVARAGALPMLCRKVVERHQLLAVFVQIQRRLGVFRLIGFDEQLKCFRTIGEAKRQLEKGVYPLIGDTPAVAVTPEDVREILHCIEKRNALRLRNAVRVTVRWLYTWAAEDGPGHPRHHPNPVATIRR